MKKFFFPFLLGLLVANIVIAQKTNSGVLLFSEGKVLFDQGKYAAAVPVFEQSAAQFEAEKQNAQLAKALDYLARSQVFSGKSDVALETYLRAYAIAKAANAIETMLDTGTGLSEIYHMRGQHRDALPYQKIVMYYNQKSDDLKSYANILTTLGMTYLQLGQLDSAKIYMEESLRIKDAMDQPEDLPLNYNHLSLLYHYLGDEEQSLVYHFKCLKVLEEQGDSAQMTLQIRNIADFFAAQGNLSRAEEYGRRAIDLATKLNLLTYRAAATGSLANIREKQGAINEALQLHEKALKDFQMLKQVSGEILELSRLGSLYLNQGLYERAEYYLEQALARASEQKLPSEMINMNLSLANLHLVQNHPAKAKPFIDAARPDVIQINQPRTNLSFYTLLSQYQEQTGDFKNALQSARTAAVFRDTIFNLEQSEAIHEMEGRYERAKKDREIVLLNSENDLKDLRLKQSRKTNILSLIGLTLATGVGFLLYYFNRLRRHTNEELAEKNSVIATSLAEKEILLREIHHRVKNNLQVVSSLLRLQTKYIEDQKALDAIQEGRNRVKSMAMIHQNLYQDDNLTGIRVDDYIKKLSESLFHSYNIDPERIHLTTNIDNLNLDVDTLIPLGLILNELLTNALKYAFPEGQEGEVGVKLKRNEDGLLLEVKDNGVGMKTGTSQSNPESGFGMKLIEAFADKLKAKVEIDRTEGTAVRLLIQNYKLA